MDHAQQGQVSHSAAELYEAFFVPALFLEPARCVARAAEIRPSDAVLDVACGTGVLARAAARYTGAGGSVTGLDRNEGMLAVASRLAPAIHWQHGLAEELPFADQAFNRVLSQFGLMFFDDRGAALREMKRVLRPDGRLLIAVWDKLERSPGYQAMVALLDRLFGARVADALRAPFVLGDIDVLRSTFAASGLNGARIETLDLNARFPSLEAWVQTDVKAWTLADMIDDAQYQTLLRAARRELTQFQCSDRSVAFSAPAHLVTIVD